MHNRPHILLYIFNKSPYIVTLHIQKNAAVYPIFEVYSRIKCRILCAINLT